MGPGDSGSENQGRKLTAELRAPAGMTTKPRNGRGFGCLGGPSSPFGLCRTRYAFAYRMAAPREAEGVAWWTGPPGLTINRRSRLPRGSEVPR